MNNKIRILVLTNKDSDNIGDQIIEGCVASIIKAVMMNLGIPNDGFSLNLMPAGIIAKKYIRTSDPALLQKARNIITDSDIIIFGGAPLFNFRYQNFYKRTITTLEIANESNIPVIFSSIGVEEYDEASEKCQELKRALNLPCVRMITTRDDFESVQKYKESDQLLIAKVADPAVFTDVVFRDERFSDRNFEQHIKAIIRKIRKRSPAKSKVPKPSGRDVIGLMPVRGTIFQNNGIDFSEENQLHFWNELIMRLENNGYDYFLFSSGHYADEIFLNKFVSTFSTPDDHYITSVNCPEELIEPIKSCSGIIAYRLHASITSYVYGIPSVGLVWNPKVSSFYNDIGYGNRAIERVDWSAETVTQRLEEAMREGVSTNPDYFMTIYRTLYDCMRDIIKPPHASNVYTYKELVHKLPRQITTGKPEYIKLINRKLKRIYKEIDIPKT